MDVYPTSTSQHPVNGTNTTLHGWLVYTKRNVEDTSEHGLHVKTTEDNGFSLTSDDPRESTRLLLRDVKMPTNGLEALPLHTVKTDDDGYRIWLEDDQRLVILNK